MNTLSTLWRRILFLVRRDSATRELEDEMRLHRVLRSESLQAQGVSAHEAEHAAARRFGNPLRVSEESRDTWGLGSLDELGQNVRYAVRRLNQHRGFAVSVIGVLALGIGATTAMFSAVDAAMLRPLPFERPDELVTITANVPFDRTGFRRAGGPVPESAQPPNIIDVAKMSETFASVAAYATGGLNLSAAERPRRINAGVVTADFFTTLGVRPYRGRAFLAEEGVPNGPRSVILSWGLWMRQFGGADMIGKDVPLNGRSYQVVGIMNKGFGFPEASELWIPMTVPTTNATFEPFRGFLPSTTIARIAPGMTVEGANARLIARWEQYLAASPAPAPGTLSHAQRMVAQVRSDGAAHPLRAQLVGEGRRALLVLLGATGLLLLIACTNVTNLLLAYGTSRRRELAVRGALGATRTRVVRQLLTESVLLSVSGALAGIALAPIVLRGLRTLMPAKLDGLSPAHLDLRVLAFAATLGLLTGVAFGIWPALGATRDATSTIKSGGGHGASVRGARRVQRLLIGAEIALSVMLLVGAGLMLRSFRELLNLDAGFSAERTATLEFSFARASGDVVARRARLDRILDELRATPGITAAGVINDLPLRARGGIAISIEADGVAKPDTAEDAYARYLVASEDYFNAMGIPLVRGRFFTRNDDVHAPPVAIISETMAKVYWRDIDPIGRTFRFGGDTARVTVVGIVRDVRESALEDDLIPQMYYPARTNIEFNLALVARGPMEPALLLRRITEAVRDADRTQAVYNVRMMDDVVGASVASRRANTLLISLFGLLGLAISAFGVYAVTSYAVAQRSRELGIRAALGATRPDLFRHIGNEITWVAIGGIALGTALAWALSRVMRSLIYGVTVHDVQAFAFAPLLLLAVVAVATIVPARRASRVNPVEVMRGD